MSLGIDLSPALKQCNFDCLYCELAPSYTVASQTDTISVEEIIQALKQHLNENIDVITLTANGEPTLYPHLSRLIDEIDAIKNKTQTLILTNSATLSDPDVYNALLKLDQVKLSLDAITPEIFKKIDRPHKTIEIKNIINKAIEFSHQYKGKLYIEILFVHGLNDTKEEIAKLNSTLHAMKIQRIDLGTIDRPPAYPVEGLGYKELRELSLMFDSSLPINIASRKDTKANNSFYSNEEIINTLDKRPLSMEDIKILFDEDSLQRFHTLLKKEILTKKIIGDLEFFVPIENIKRKREKESR
jgi:wyosine [tRNA(Phe)-imidazoG37] synthetase (radical SAM superfamily)